MPTTWLNGSFPFLNLAPDQPLSSIFWHLVDTLNQVSTPLFGYLGPHFYPTELDDYALGGTIGFSSQWLGSHKVCWHISSTTKHPNGHVCYSSNWLQRVLLVMHMCFCFFLSLVGKKVTMKASCLIFILLGDSKAKTIALVLYLAFTNMKIKLANFSLL